MKNVNEPVAASSNSMPMSIVHATMLSLACLTGCASSSSGITPGDIPSNTQLALSPNGKRLLVSWNDSNEKLHAKLVELNGSEVASTRELSLPPNTYTTAFTASNKKLLLTTLEKGESDLVTFDLDNNQINLIYKSNRIMRFPLEVDEGNYVFLEGADPASRTNQWQRYQHGRKTLLNPKNYNMAARLDVVNDALFILEPYTPPAFRNLHGGLPKGLSALVDSKTHNIVCADKNPLTCVRNHIYYDPQSYGTMEIFNGGNRCVIAGRWIDDRELLISRDGSTVVFHAAIHERDGPRAIYVVKNDNVNCSVNSISIKGN